MKNLLPALCLAVLAAPLTATETPVAPPRPIVTTAPLSPAKPLAVWVAIKVRKDERDQTFFYLKSEIAKIHDGAFVLEAPLYAADPGGGAQDFTLKPAGLKLRIARTADGKPTQAKIVTDAGGPWFEGSSYSGIKTDLAAATGGKAIVVAGAPAAAAPGGLSAYEQAARDALFATDQEKAECMRDVAACRRKLAQTMTAAIGAQRDKNADLDPAEDKYVHTRLGDADYAKLQEKLKSKALTPAAVRERLYAEMKGYSNPALTNQSAYDPDQTNAGLKALVEPPKSGTQTERPPSTPVGLALAEAYSKLPDTDRNKGNYDFERDALTALIESKHPDAAQHLDELKDPNSPLFKKYRDEAAVAAREHILDPSKPSPFGNIGEPLLLDAYCDILKPAGPAAPAKACAPTPGASPAKQQLEMAACSADGRSFDGNQTPAATDDQKIKAKCEKIWAQHDEQRKHPRAGAQLPNDGLAGTDSGTRVPPSANPLDDCKGGAEKCAAPPKPGPNDKLPWETGVVWAAVAMIALGILTGGIGLAVIAGAAAAGMVGWYMGKEANR